MGPAPLIAFTRAVSIPGPATTLFLDGDDLDLLAGTSQGRLADGEIQIAVRLVRGSNRSTVQLFDAVEDPLDQRDLAADRPELVDALLERLAAMRGAGPLETGWTTIEVDAALDDHLREMGYAGDEEED